MFYTVLSLDDNMSTLRGIFPEPKKEQKKNFIRENVKQLKLIQGKIAAQPKFATKAFPTRVSNNPLAESSLSHVKSSPSSKSGKLGLNVVKTTTSSTRKKYPDVKIKKGDMAEFLKRKELLRQAKPEESPDEGRSEESLGRLRDVACQTIESNLAQKLEESTKITMLYPKREEEDSKYKACGDSEKRHRSPVIPSHSPRRTGDDLADYERPRSRLNAILERKDHNKDPYLPSGYQKGVLPKYLRDRKEQGVKETEGAKADDESATCPSGHVTLPDTERKETLRMLRNSFAELVSELNKMPVKTDTLRMRNRKMELEKQLTKLEEGIKVFSRPKVFVKIGE